MLSYRRAVWLGDDLQSIEFERFVRQALNKLPTVSDTAITRDSGQVLSCISRELRTKGGVCLHVTAMTPGSEASVISRAGIKIIVTNECRNNPAASQQRVYEW